jgi:hypothetical protein
MRSDLDFGREPNSFCSAIRQRRPKRGAEFRVAIMQNIRAWMKVAPGFLGRAAGDLFHPLLIRVLGYTGDGDTAALQMNEKQNVVGDESASAQGETLSPSVPASPPTIPSQPSQCSLVPSSPPGARLPLEPSGVMDIAGVWNH